MNEKFDNFRFYLAVKREMLDDLTAEQKANTLQYGFMGFECTSREYSLAQVIYAYYMPNFGFDYLVNHVDLLPIDERTTFYHIIDVMRQFKKNMLEELDEICSDIKYKREDAQVIEDALPLCPSMLKNFLIEYDYKNHLDIELSSHLALLLTTDLYNSLLSDDFDLYQNRMDEISSALRKYSKVENINDVLRNLKKFLRKWSVTLGFKESLEPTNNSKHPVADGDFILSWQFVTFVKGFIYFFHPFHPNQNPFKLINEKSISAFNDIKSYFAGRLPHIHVKAQSGRIQKIHNIEDIDLSVEKLTEKYLGNSQLNIKRKVNINTMTDEQLRNFIHQQKSKYLNWLCDRQLKDYKIYYIREIQTNSDLVDNDEDAFAFTISDSPSNVTVVYENTKDSRSSLVFQFPISSFIETIHDIHRFFSSNSVNKREMIAKHKIIDGLFKENSYKRVLHQNFEQWKAEITAFSKR